MRYAAPWVALVIGAVVVAAPWTEAKTSRATVGVQIIMPPRPDLAVPSPIEEALSAPSPAPASLSAEAAIPPVQRTATVIHDGRSTTLLVTDIPLF